MQGMTKFAVTPQSPTSVDYDPMSVTTHQMKPVSPTEKRNLVAQQYPSFANEMGKPQPQAQPTMQRKASKTIYGRFVQAMEHRGKAPMRRRYSESIPQRRPSFAYDSQAPMRHSLPPVACYSPMANQDQSNLSNPPIVEARSQRTNMRLAATIRELKLSRSNGNRAQEMELIKRMNFILAHQRNTEAMQPYNNEQQKENQSPDEDRIVGRVRTRWETKYFPALQAYLKIHGNMLVPRKYVVPESSSEWPRAAWGVRLGNVVHNLRRGIYKCIDHRDKAQLNEMGFVWQARIRRPRKAVQESA